MQFLYFTVHRHLGKLSSTASMVLLLILSSLVLVIKVISSGIPAALTQPQPPSSLLLLKGLGRERAGASFPRHKKTELLQSPTLSNCSFGSLWILRIALARPPLGGPFCTRRGRRRWHCLGQKRRPGLGRWIPTRNTAGWGCKGGGNPPWKHRPWKRLESRNLKTNPTNHHRPQPLPGLPLGLGENVGRIWPELAPALWWWIILSPYKKNKNPVCCVYLAFKGENLQLPTDRGLGSAIRPVSKSQQHHGAQDRGPKSQHSALTLKRKNCPAPFISRQEGRLCY